MAKIELKLTQEVFDSGLLTDPNRAGDVLGTLALMLADAATGVRDDAGDAGKLLLSGGKLRLEFPDGSYDEFGGITLADPGALKGSGTATSAKLHVPGQGTSEQTGSYRFSYDLTGAVPTAQRISSTTTHVTVESLLPDSADNYDTVLGNATLAAKGAITVNASGQLGGTISSLTLAADELLSSATMSGAFGLSGNVGDLAEGMGTVGIAGTLNSLDMRFKDGSSAALGGLAARVDDISLGNALAVLEGGALAGNDTIRVELPDWLGREYTVAAGAGDDTIVVGGGGGMLHVDAGAGDDTITVLSDHHRIDGGAGFDTLVYRAPRKDYTIVATAEGIEIRGEDGVDLVNNVERVQFAGTTLAFDVDGAAGQAYRFYQAALGRAPDAGGLGFYVHVLDSGVSLDAVAGGFLASDEFAERFGARLTDGQFVERLYENMLGRASEPGGFDFWTGMLGKGLSRATVLATFSESLENRERVELIGAIQSGMEYTPFQS